MLYATMPTQDSFIELLRLWRRYERGHSSEHGYAPWWQLFDMLAELRPWGPKDRLSAESRAELENRLPSDDETEVKLELEHWPRRDKDSRNRWRRETKAKVAALQGRIIDQSAIEEGSFVYDAVLVGLAAGTVREMLDDPYAPDGLATLDGLQFVLPQTIAQSVPSHSQPVDDSRDDFDGLDSASPFRILLLDGTPIAGHRALDGGVAVEDVHDLVDRSIVASRRHATEMASLILRGDLDSDGHPLRGSRLLAIPLLIDTEQGATSPDDRLFVDLVHAALQSAFRDDDPLAPEAFVVNFSIGVRGSNFAGRISSLARLLDWWANQAGVLFVVSAGNVEHDLRIPSMTLSKFEGLSLLERQDRVRAAQRRHCHERTLLAPSEALNALTVGAASLDSAPSPMNTAPNTIPVHAEGDTLPAISSGLGLGPFGAIKPDVIGIGGHHELRALPAGNDLRLQVVSPSTRTGLNVATAGVGSPQSRTRGTSCAAALVTRSLLNATAALTEEGGPYEGRELSRNDLVLLARALAINASRWPEAARALYDTKKAANGGRFQQAGEEVARHFGYGFLDPDLMREAPLHGVTLVGLGQVRKDRGTIFDMPLPSSLSGDSVHRSMLLTLTWFSPVEPARARYRLAALEAIAADGDVFEDDAQDKHWSLAMKSAPPAVALIKRGTAWSRRLVHDRMRSPEFDDAATLPIRVQCRDASGGGLDQDLDIPFAIAVTLQVAETAKYDVHEEIRNQLQVRLHGEHRI
ncbi:MAG: S8 family serine peptidase [Bryobacterales bacterium]|nr:S8 family serine peptidase [Bryobacterales bacterium]